MMNLFDKVKVLCALVMMGLGFAAYSAAPTVTSVTAQQRYPWNGLVDIAVTFNGEQGDVAKANCTFAATDSATKTALPVVHITREGSDSGSGNVWTRSFVWDTLADVGGMRIDDVELVVEIDGLGGVQLWEGGPYWAECNVGASKPEEYGLYFWWGDTVGHAGDWYFDVDHCPTYGKSNAELQSLGYIDSTANLTKAHDAATVHLGAPWRMPTRAEVVALIDNCTSLWTTHNGVLGRIVTGKGVYASKNIFLPAAGFGYFYDLSYEGSVGRYWYAAPDLDRSDRSMALAFNSGDFTDNSGFRYYGRSVRPVRGFAVTSTASTHLRLDNLMKVAPVACDWTKGEIELGWSGADVSYKLFWSTSSDPDVSTNDIQRQVKTDVTPAEEGAYRFTCKDPVYLTRGDCLQPIYYHIVGTDGSWSYCKTRTRYGLVAGIDKYEDDWQDDLSGAMGAVSQAESFKNEFVKTCERPETVHFLKNEEVTESRLRYAFTNEIANAADPGDLVVLYLCSHGGGYSEPGVNTLHEGEACVAFYKKKSVYLASEMGSDVAMLNSHVGFVGILYNCHSGMFLEQDQDDGTVQWLAGTPLSQCSKSRAWIAAANSTASTPKGVFGRFFTEYGWKEGWAGENIGYVKYDDSLITFGAIGRYSASMVERLLWEERKSKPVVFDDCNILDNIVAGRKGVHDVRRVPAKPDLTVSRGEYPDKVVCEWEGPDGADGYVLFEKRERDEKWSYGHVLADSTGQDNGYERPWTFKNDEDRPYSDDRGKFHIKAYNGAGISPASDAVDGWCSWVEGKIGDLSYAYNLNADGSATLLRIGGRSGVQTGVAGQLSLPSEVDGHQVTKIATGAMRNCTGVTQVTVPNTVQALRPSSFPNCTGLKTVIFNGAMPDGVEASGVLDYATEVYYPKAYTAQYEKVVPAELFAGYVDVVIPDDGVYTKTVNGIEWTYTIKDGIAILGYDGNSYPGSAAISVSTSGKVVVPSAFDGCPLNEIGSNAFYGCDKLSEIILPDSVVTIGSDAFNKCSNLSKLDLPPRLGLIEMYAFESCESLQNIEIPASVTHVGINPFSRCTGLLDIVVQGGNENYMSKDGVMLSKDGTTLVSFPCGRAEVSFPQGVAKLDVMSLSGSMAKHICVPEAIQEMGYWVFSYSNVEEIEFDMTLSALPVWTFYNCRSLARVILPDGIESIDESALKDCSALKTFAIPRTVRRIGSQAFARCIALSIVDFAGEPPSEVADDAFANVQAACVGTYRAEHAEAWSRVIDGNGMWKGLRMVPYDESVREASVTLRNGWNWISVNVEPTDATFASAFGDVAFAENDVIQSPDGSATYSGGTWHANPSSFKLVAGRAYAVRKSTAGTATITVSGTAAPAEIAVAAGWNWIGPTATSAVSLRILTHTGGFSDGDIINSPTASATYHGGTWYGELKSIVPGSGYKARFGKAGTLRW